MRPALVRLCRLAIAAIFIASALAKIGDPQAFATQIHHYRLAPLALEHLLAITLPWIELTTGLALLVGVRARSGAWLATAMLVVFTAAVGSAMARHLNFECGCFGTADATRIGTRKLLENLAMTGAAVVASLRVSSRG